jgi:hypothetical protein
MSKKSLVLVIITALTLSLGLGVTFSLADNGPAEMIVNADGKKPASFNHAAHQEKNECGVCHHKDVDGARVANEAGDAIAGCLTCHTAEFPNEKLRTWKGIGHGQCKACHTKMKAEGAPTKCTACHPKKEAAGAAEPAGAAEAK